VCANNTYFGEAQPSEVEARLKEETEKIAAKEEEMTAAADTAATAIEQSIDAARRAKQQVEAAWAAKGGNEPAWKALGAAGRALTSAGDTLNTAAGQVLPVMMGTEPTATRIT